MTAAEILSSIPKNVKVLAVSKLQSIDKIRDLYKLCGHLDFGENYVQEALSKQIELVDLPLRWHLIGPIQSKKSKAVAGQFELIHSVDSLKLAEKISAAAVQKNVTQKILLQVNVAQEKSKNGFEIPEFEREIDKILALPNLDVQGLMTMPPLTNTAGENRPHFAKLRKMSEELRKLKNDAKVLSMGTSQDYQVAIDEGATIVRLGTVLFGARS